MVSRLLPRLAVLGVLVWLAVWATIGDSIAYLGFINGAGVIWGLSCLIFAVAFAFERAWIWMSVTALLGAAILANGTGTNTAMLAGDKSARSDDEIRIVSASLRGRNKNMDDAARVLASYDPDILAVQEASEKEQLQEALERETGQSWNMVSREFLLILTRAQISEQPEAELDHLLRATVGLNGGPFNIWTLRGPKSFDRPVVNSRYFAELQSLIASEEPDAVTGDFNATPWNDAYKRINQQMTNAHAAAGLGLGNSFPSDGRLSGMFGAFARIDHIFVKRTVPIVGAFAGHASDGADHHPVVVDVRIDSN